MLWEVLPPTIANAGSGYVEQPIVTFSGGGGGSGAAAYATVGAIPKIQTLGSALSFYTPGGEQFRVTDTAATTQFILATGSSTGNVSFSVTGAGSAGFSYVALGGASHRFWSSSSTEQMRVSHTASAVNYVQVTGGIAGTPGTVTISGQGSSANVDISITPKGSGAVKTTANAYVGSNLYIAP
jgi:hypothetical protein